MTPLKDCKSDGDITRAIKAALRAAFPGPAFSVTGGGGHIQWTDDGPTFEQVEEVLIAAGAETHFGYDGKRWVTLPGGHSIYFDRYNVVERDGYRSEYAKLRAEYAAEQERTHASVEQARRAKQDTYARPPVFRPPPEASDPVVFEAFERLRVQAESVSASGKESDRRPSWAPPMILDEQLAAVCVELGLLTSEDKPIGRLWAEFASPKRSMALLRDELSQQPLRGITCRGFQFFAGGGRESKMDRLFEAQREEDGSWRFGPRSHAVEYHSPYEREWERLVCEQEALEPQTRTLKSRAPNAERLAKIKAAIAEINEADVARARKQHDRQVLWARALELARARVLNFIGAPEAQMQVAGRMAGQCCICWKLLTDPISLERGIGPECYGHLVDGIRRRAADGYSPERISAVVGTSVELINAVLSEAKPRPLQIDETEEVSGEEACWGAGL